MKKNTLLIIGGVIVAYYLWKKSQETSETVIVEEGEMSNVGGSGVKSYKGSGGRKICYVVSPRGSMQEVPCP